MYTSAEKKLMSNDLKLYAIFVDDIKPTASMNVTPTQWQNSDGLVSITALDEGSGIDRVELYEKDLSRGTEKLVKTFRHYGTNETILDTYSQTREGEYIYTAYVYDKDGNVTKLVSRNMKIDKSAPVIHGLDKTVTTWTNKAPVISVNATDYLKDTTYVGSDLKQVVIKDYNGKVMALGIDSCKFTLTDKYEGTREFTIEATDNVGNTKTETIITRYDNTKPVIIGDESSAVDNSVYVSNNNINQACNDYYTNSRYANDSSGVKEVKLYAYKDGILEEVKSNATRITFAFQNKDNNFTCRHKIKEDEKDIEYFLLVVKDFSGNESTKKITSQRYLLTTIRTSIDESSFS